MRLTLVLITICLAGTVSAGSTAFAAEAKKPLGGTIHPGVMGPIVKELTTNECIGLGGDVYDQKGCKTGKVCKTKDYKGRVHYQCITKRS
jgi:hypothetical protein